MKKNTKRYVLDTFALFVYLNKERGFDSIVKILKDSEENNAQIYFSTINLGELFYVLIREVGQVQATNIVTRIQSLPIEFVEVDTKFILQTALIKAQGGLSYADSFAVYLAVSKDATLITGDREFAKFSNAISIKWI